jgi:hypothetical protein
MKFKLVSISGGKRLVILVLSTLGAMGLALVNIKTQTKIEKGN